MNIANHPFLLVGEVRDIPSTAIIHGSVMRRMEADPKYRPGNLIGQYFLSYSVLLIVETQCIVG